jgi:hypothetical protein
MVTMYAGWQYVLVEAGPEQAATWRRNKDGLFWGGVLPDLMFPIDRSWLLSTLWDDDWACIGGSASFVGKFLRHPRLQARSVELGMIGAAWSSERAVSEYGRPGHRGSLRSVPRQDCASTHSAARHCQPGLPRPDREGSHKQMEGMTTATWRTSTARGPYSTFPLMPGIEVRTSGSPTPCRAGRTKVMTLRGGLSVQFPRLRMIRPLLPGYPAGCSRRRGSRPAATSARRPDNSAAVRSPPTTGLISCPALIKASRTPLDTVQIRTDSQGTADIAVEVAEMTRNSQGLRGKEIS